MMWVACMKREMKLMIVSGYQLYKFSTPLLRFFQGKCCAYPFGKKKGARFGMEGVVVNADVG
jgi:hypothetical protein